MNRLFPGEWKWKYLRIFDRQFKIIHHKSFPPPPISKNLKSLNFVSDRRNNEIYRREGGEGVWAIMLEIALRLIKKTKIDIFELPHVRQFSGCYFILVNHKKALQDSMYSGGGNNGAPRVCIWLVRPE